MKSTGAILLYRLEQRKVAALRKQIEVLKARVRELTTKGKHGRPRLYDHPLLVEGVMYWFHKGESVREIGKRIGYSKSLVADIIKRETRRT